MESWDYKLSNEPTIIKIGQGLTNFLTLTLILTGLASGLGLDLGLTLASISQPILKSKPVLESRDYKLSNEPKIIKIGQGFKKLLTLGLASGLGLGIRD